MRFILLDGFWFVLMSFGSLKNLISDTYYYSFKGFS